MMVVGWSFPLTFLMQSRKLNKSEKYITKEHCVFQNFRANLFQLSYMASNQKLSKAKITWKAERNLSVNRRLNVIATSYVLTPLLHHPIERDNVFSVIILTDIEENFLMYCFLHKVKAKAKQTETA